MFARSSLAFDPASNRVLSPGCLAAAQPTGIGQTTAGGAVARPLRLQASPLGPPGTLVEPRVRPEQERQKPDQQNEGEDGEFHTHMIGTNVD
jgi:hypothetical protein